MLALQEPQVVGSEQMTSIALEQSTGFVFAILKHYAPASLRLKYEHDRDRNIAGCRPDSYYMINGRLALGGEERVTCTISLLDLRNLFGLAEIQCVCSYFSMHAAKSGRL